MRAGLLAAAILLAAAVAGCGGDDDEPAAAGSSTTTAPSTTAAGADGPTSPPETECPDDLASPEAVSGSLELVPAGPLHAGQPAAWRLTFQPDREVTLVFPTGQDGEVVLTDASGAEVWRWSSDVLFTQAIRCLVVDAGTPFTAELTGTPLTVGPGTYTATGTLAAQEGLAPATIEVSVEP